MNHIRHMMQSKGVTSDELASALEALQELEKEHGEALKIVKLFEDDAIESTIQNIQQ